MRYLMLFFFGLLAVPRSDATTVNIDFDELAAGTVVTNQYSAQGVTFSLSNGKFGAPPVAGPAVTSVNPAANPGLSGNAISPGDDANEPFYNIEVTLGGDADFASFWVGDFEESLQVLLFEGDREVYRQNISGGTVVGGIQPTQFLTFGALGGALLFDRMILNIVEGGNPVDLNNPEGGPEYFDKFSFNLKSQSGAEVPEPATAALLLSGLGAARLRRRQAV